jgi:hypothetical protein
MRDFKKVVIIENEFEAEILEGILNDKEIPFLLKCYHDSAYDGLFQFQKGWGHIEAPDEFADQILEIYGDVQKMKEEE